MFFDSNIASSSDTRNDILTAEPISHLNTHSILCDERTVYIANTLKTIKAVSSPPSIETQPFTHGLVGFCSYEMGTYAELRLNIKVASKHHRTSSFPESFIGFYTWSYVYDYAKEKGFITFSPFCPQSLREKIFDLIKSQDKLTPTSSSMTATILSDLSWTKSQTFSEYAHAFEQIQNYIRNGDCYQVNLTQRFAAESVINAVDLYFDSRKHIQTPYSCFFAFSATQHLLSFSPEQFISINQRVIQSKPIKGTIKNSGAQEIEERALNSAKNHAENVMIVDLLRNDLGRVCKTHSVSVPELLKIETYKNVHHLVSTIRGQLRDDISEFDAFFSCFPGGSITGAPKIRSMEIIHELEKHARSAYCGSVFYLNHNGRFDSNILIRSVIKDNDKLYCWAGGGIVADSEVKDEYQESLTKVSNITGLES